MITAHPFYIILQALKVLLIKISKILAPVLLFIALHQQISLYTYIHNFLEFHSTLSEKKISATNFPFLTDLPKPLSF